VPDMSMKDTLSEMAGKLEGIRLLTVIDTDCMVLASWESPDNELSPETLGEFIQKTKSMISTFQQSASGVNKLDDVILGTPFSYMMLMSICNGTCFIVADAPRAVSLGSIRKAFKMFAYRLEQSMPGHEPQPLAEGASHTSSQIEPANKYLQLR
jgi:hypothetical protein